MAFLIFEVHSVAFGVDGGWDGMEKQLKTIKDYEIQLKYGEIL